MIVAFFLGHLFVLAHAGGLRGAASRRGRTSAARGAAPAGSGPCGPTALDGLRTLGVRTLARTLGCASRAAARRRPAPAAAGAAFSRQPPGAEDFLTGVLAIRAQAQQPRKAAEPGLKDCYAILLDERCRPDTPKLGLILLDKRHRAGNCIADIDWRQILKIHLGGKEAEHPADMGQHASGEQAGDDAPSVPVLAGKGVIEMVGIIIASDATEQRHIPVGERAPKGEGMPHLQSVKCSA